MDGPSGFFKGGFIVFLSAALVFMTMAGMDSERRANARIWVNERAPDKVVSALVKEFGKESRNFHGGLNTNREWVTAIWVERVGTPWVSCECRATEGISGSRQFEGCRRSDSSDPWAHVCESRTSPETS